jgi:hypothetical protein
VIGVYARWHTLEEKREAVMAIEAAVLPLMPNPSVAGLKSGRLRKTLRQ